MSAKQNIVVVGSGGAGTNVVRELVSRLRSYSDQYDVVLISTLERYVHIPALLRMAVSSEDNLEETALIPTDNLFTERIGRLKVGTVSRVEQASRTGEEGGIVVLESGEEVPYRYLVLATGSVWEGPLAGLSGDTSKLLSTIRDWRAKFGQVKSIVIIGGGSIGLELSGELQDIFPTIKITIVHAGHLPLNEAYPEKFRKDVKRRWEARGVEFIFNDRILDDYPHETAGTAMMASGKSISADLFVPARGGRPNTAYLKSLGDDILDARGYVRIAPTLQLTEYRNIFAAGDIMAFDEQKAIAKTLGHAKVVAENIMSLLAGVAPKKTYGGTFEGLFITNGKNKGAGYIGVLWGLMFGDWVVPMMKGKDLFITHSRKTFGVAT